MKKIILFFYLKIMRARLWWRRQLKRWKIPPKPECEKYWTTLYYGHRGSGKTLHQAKEVWKMLKYLEWLYRELPLDKQAIVFTIQKFSPEIESKYCVYKYAMKKIKIDGSYIDVLDTDKKEIINEKGFLYYWSDAKQLRFCPRLKCWKGTKAHRLHGAYVIFDDIATIIPADGWVNTPIWLRKTFTQARHFGIRILANCQDPFSTDVNFRRYTDMCYRFKKIIGSRDPDETKPPVKNIWGFYIRRKVAAEVLWKYGDISGAELSAMRERSRDGKSTSKSLALAKSFIGWPYWIGKKICSIYDTTQDVPEYVPSGYSHIEIKCKDPAHPDCGYIKQMHRLE